MDGLILKAARFADRAHYGAFRKWGRSKDPYIVHPLRVAKLVSENPRATEEMIAAAWLHDTIEDCGVTAEGLKADGFPESVVSMVVGLTKPNLDKGIPRAERKRIGREMVAAGSWEVRLIKLADRIDNLTDVVEGAGVPEGFAEKYLDESRLLLEALKGTDGAMEGRLADMLEAAGKK